MVMSNSVRVFSLPAVAAATAALFISSPAAAAPAGPYAGLCRQGKPAVLARVSGLKAPRGIVSVKLYASDRDTFLEKSAYLQKVKVPVSDRGPIDVCVPVPASGRYALSVRHQVGGDKSRSDGGGFSGNPDVSLLDVALQRKPSLNKVSFTVNGSTRVVPITLRYLQGGSFRAVS
jgi:uncharacterized protein (DUF2141 family)